MLHKVMTSTSEVRICCGDAVGTLSLTSGRVSCQGQDVSTTEFERMGGRASSKKWKQSVRVISDDGTAGKLIGDWLTDRGLDVKNNRVIQLGEVSSTSQGLSIVPKSSTQSHSPVDVRRELATPINSKMHTIFSSSKPIESGQMPPTLQHSSQSQNSLQHQQHVHHEPTPVAPAATLSNPPFQNRIRQGPAQEPNSQAPGASSGSVAAVAALPQSTHAPSAALWAYHGVTPLQASGQAPHSMPLKRLPAEEHPVTSSQKTIGLQTQQPQLQSELPLRTALLVGADQIQILSGFAAPPAAATPLQSASALAKEQFAGPTSLLAATAAERCAVQTQQQEQPNRGPQADAPPATQQVSKQMLPKQTPVHMPQARPAGASQTDLLQHLQLSYPGLVPGDSTAELPKELVNLPEDSSSSTRTVIDMTTVTEEELMAMSGSSAEVPLRAMFPIPPGIVPSREAHMTGHRPLKRQRPTIAPLSSDEAAAQIGQYMAGELKNEPWHAFGLGKAPTVAGRDLNLKQLYKAVQSCGGFASCVASRSFAKVTTKLGIDKTAMTNASFLLRNHYVKFLLAYEQQMQILASADEAETKLDEATLDASSWPTDSSGPAGHEDSAGEDAEPRSTTAPGGWSGQSLPGKAVTIIQDSKQESTGRPPLQIEAAAPTGALSLEAKAVLGMEAGVNSLGTSQELLADACIEEATPVNDDAAAGGLETPSRWC